MIYNSINRYIPKRYLMNKYIEQNNIQCAFFVGNKIKIFHIETEIYCKSAEKNISDYAYTTLKQQKGQHIEQ